MRVSVETYPQHSRIVMLLSKAFREEGTAGHQGQNLSPSGTKGTVPRDITGKTRSEKIRKPSLSQNPTDTRVFCPIRNNPNLSYQDLGIGRILSKCARLFLRYFVYRVLHVSRLRLPFLPLQALSSLPGERKLKL